MLLPVTRVIAAVGFHLIENCRGGVDIQPIAVTAKLRCFISLVVEQEPTTRRPT
jgi:hypothetical protein